jgi:hypothetical protein
MATKLEQPHGLTAPRPKQPHGLTAPRPKQPHGPPMTLGNKRHLGAHNLVTFCLDGACRHSALSDVSKYLPTPVRPNWKEQPPSESPTGTVWR